MTHSNPPIARPRRLSPCVPAFHTVPLRAIHNGWSPERQAHFIGWLAETGSVSAACERVGMSHKGAYQLRKKPHSESFAAAWDAALGWPVRKVTVDEWDVLVHGTLFEPRFRRGRYIGFRRKSDTAGLSRMLNRIARQQRQVWP
ncbi:hypothetical protein GRI89_08980 [Altererythrobacter salegens]|uniref:Uncharacterized protein n=1 Tax=Croceibacterium salegens TaxID=1737568 RepID=A0A6I4SZH0_9SPHN|nr:hypothetical protein [Croceibacterium salegens]MXO59672.1 hypothetical protein [Croceibacterium salegens]